MNISTEITNSQSTSTEPTEPTEPTEQRVKLIEIKVENEQIALNLMIAFLDAAQSRGIYSIEESAKLWECVKFFSKPAENTDKSV
tara:strand:- start:306 stop:560 length:255 start_codon:yes stop_codon:yes gene_type:complete